MTKHIGAPPDFHAFVEVFLGQRWYLVDPSNAAVPMGLLRIGTGRDAADVPIAMVFGNVKPSRPLVEVQAVASSAPGFSMPMDTARGISTW
ncbi:transglutaminase family protein [Ralstonia solanacearum]|nr:transglutaminase family protein [Ralstonia pseudosolanacearum]MDD7790008.1 transglutaminase family protein [Ralstonia pseudosolanacearum]